MKTITVFGGSGFIGRYVIQNLAQAGYNIRVAVRFPVQANFLKVLGRVGQITPICAPVNIPELVDHAIQKSDGIINLTGILFEKKNQTFEHVHVDGVRNIAKAAQKYEIQNVVHVSALGQGKNSTSQYARTKALGEEVLRSHVKEAVILRPSVVFGPEDQFFNRFAEIACLSPFIPLIGGGHTKLQPIYVGDVAEAITRVLGRYASYGNTYEIGGPFTYTFRELMILMLKVIERERILLSLPYSLATLMGWFGQFLPTPPLTADQVELLKADNIVSGKYPTISDLGIDPKTVEAIIPSYLGRFRRVG
ncbi:Complex I NDUFA9 subunit family protein [Candidatus Bealeia paramacronuclearis]|uniref:Complex I NDUFA9 subunit family protein n=1 Tax=Candidatus Bealeia paramacronuclearis TaxID=1921001 RepID=A0ABZ2C6K1_9PROT|nr:Complex I NDUFA9 subunit family protein [Candidatus Bealeia paramacronuclearis]